MNDVPNTAPTPGVVFKKKTWRHREQELKFKKQIREIVGKTQPLFVIEPLPEDDRVWYIHLEGSDLQEIRLKRCAICWEPATLIERCVHDSTYHRWLCTDHQHK